MISDRTIEERTAKYWYAFADKKFKIALDTVLANIKNKTNQEIVNAAILKQEALSEGFVDAMNRTPIVGGPGFVFQIANADEDMMKTQANHALAASAATAAIAIPQVRDAAKSIGATAIKNPKATALTVAGATLAANAVSDEDDSWWQKLEKLVNKIWDIGEFTAKHGKAIAIASTTAFALFKTANIWMPLIGSFVKSLLRGNSLATVDFDSNGRWYRMRYDVNSKRWELLYKGFSMGASPDPQETNQLIDTKFFKSFVNQCKKYIDPIATNNERTAVIEAIGQLSDKKTKQALKLVFDDPAVLDNMFAMKFKY